MKKLYLILALCSALGLSAARADDALGQLVTDGSGYQVYYSAVTGAYTIVNTTGKTLRVDYSENGAPRTAYVLSKSGVSSQTILGVGVHGTVQVIKVVELEPVEGLGAQDRPALIKAGEASWQDSSLKGGLKVAWLFGDPKKAELTVEQVKFPANYRIAAHTHPYTELLTVLSGTYYAEMTGTDPLSKCEIKISAALKAGDTLVYPAGAVLKDWTNEETIVQLSFIGPSAIDFVNPTDDPRTLKQAEK